MMKPTNEGVKNDSEKPQLELLSSMWVEGVGRVLTFGAKKYAAHNWRKGLKRTRLLGAALRHIFADLAGQDLDAESGLPHLDHASCCLMFARELHETRPDLDDRYRPETTPRATPGSGGDTGVKLAISGSVICGWCHRSFPADSTEAESVFRNDKCIACMMKGPNP